MVLRKEPLRFNMGKLFETHSHLFMEPLNRNFNAVLERAFAVGVERIIVPALSVTSWNMCSDLSVLPGIDCALGLHPWWADEGLDISELKDKLLLSNAVAIGEVGLDWKVDVSRKVQIEVLKQQLQLALEMDLPVILHCHKAFEELLNLLEDYPVRGVIHGWSKNFQLMERFLEAGLYISFGGIITKPDAHKARKSVTMVPENRYLLETDSPSMGLKGVKSGASEPMYILEVANIVAEQRNEPLEQILEATWENSVTLFGETE